VWGQVQQGARRGRKLGFPTVNLALPASRLTPAFGVYACWGWREDRGYPAVVNVGVRPSFDTRDVLSHNDRPTVEAYLLDFEGDLYGETLGLSFIKRLREEQRFTDAGALVAQIQADAEAARRILADPADDAQTGSPPVRGAGRQAQFWTELPHTADLAIRVSGNSQRQLFARTAAAMYRLQDADATRPIALACAVNVSGADVVELLVAWLNRLLLRQELNEELYTRFEIHELSAVGLRGVAYGYHGFPAHTAIKAATYHNLNVETTAAGWTATVTFDV
jgi:SHS2 domain-containing protein